MQTHISDGDMDVIDFAKLIGRLPPHLPISDAMEAAEGLQGGRWPSQRKHLTTWFRSQATLGHGAYTRQTPNRSAKLTYNRFQCAEGFIWLAEAAGVPASLVQQAATAASSAPHRSQCRIVREYIPWDMVYQALTEKVESSQKSGTIGRKLSAMVSRWRGR